MGTFTKITGFKWVGWIKATNEPEGTKYHTAFSKESEKAVFIMPNRVEEIIKHKPDVTLDDILV